MATDDELVQVMVKVAENFSGERFTITDTGRLIQAFNDADGSSYEKARKAITDITGVPVPPVMKFGSASDNSNRLITDLDAVIGDWKPNS